VIWVCLRILLVVKKDVRDIESIVMFILSCLKCISVERRFVDVVFPFILNTTNYNLSSP